MKARPLSATSFALAISMAVAATPGCGTSNDAGAPSSSETGETSSTRAATGASSPGASSSASATGASTAATSGSGAHSTGASGGSGSGTSSESGSNGSSTSGSPAQSASSSTASSTSSRTSSSSSSVSGGGEGALTTGIRAFPAPGATGVCPDPPLRMTFASPPTLGSSGKIRVYDASSTATPVATLDMGASSYSETLEGTTYNMLRPAFVDGNDAVVYLPPHSLTYGKTYYVTVDSGAIVGPGGAAVSVTSTTGWRFSTAAAAPSSASAGVALDGSQPFCSVQGALDAIPAKNTAAVTITIQPGTYHEIVHLSQKNNVTILGVSRTGTLIEGENNSNVNASTQGRSLVGVDNSSGVAFDTLSITNTTPQGGSQAEALRLQSCDECVVRNANIASLQDTLLWSGRVYASNSTISGNVDFVWGDGVAYFDKCDIHTTGRAGAIVQSRNSATGYGYVFVDSTLTADSGVTGQVLARIDVSAYPASHVAYINCTMGSFIAPVGWTITGGTSTSQLRFWEYQSVDSTGKAIDVSKRASGSTQISATQAASMRDPTVVLGGWQPP